MLRVSTLLFEDQEAMDKVLATDDPVKIKMLGKSIQNFKAAVWAKEKDSCMYNAIKQKFEQNEDLGKVLRETGNRLLVEANPNDVYWGVGASVDSAEVWDVNKWKGKNKLGKMLSDLRDELFK